nr:putative glutaredoxin [Theileria orientalis]
MLLTSYLLNLAICLGLSSFKAADSYYYNPGYYDNVWNTYSFAHPPKMTEKTPKDWVTELVKKHKVVVFSKSYCPYCTRAKMALNSLNLDDVHVEELDSHPQMDQVQDYLQELTGARSVPRVFVNGAFYGDSSKTVADVENGSFMTHFKKTEL